MDFKRIAGICGIIFAGTVFTVNAFFVGPVKPMGDTELSEIVSYYTEHGDVVRLFAYVAPFAWVAISLFAAGVVVSTQSEGRQNGWAIMGAVGIATMIATFCGVVTADLALAGRASTLAANPQFTRVLWDYHMVLQILNFTFVAMALGGFAMAAVTSKTAPRLGKFSLLGAGLLLAASTQSLAGLNGTGPVSIVLPGFLVWLIFIITYSIIMIRMAGSATT
ncbi:MAG: hypothetical protein P8Y44_10635 [Acidobacteriota bacterium]